MESVFDEQEKKIITQLIRNPRISDNQIGKITGIPIKTVNRKRKILEKKNVLNYMTMVNHGNEGTKVYRSQYMFIIKFKYGITNLLLSQKFTDIMMNKSLTKHVYFSGIGEQDGQVLMIIILESFKHDDMIEIFNAEIVPTIGNFFGSDAIADVKSFYMGSKNKLFHNYIPSVNMENGIIKKDWSDENLFI